MTMLPRASLCSLLLVWLCALGAGPVRQVAPQPVAARSAVELALRDVAEAPVIVPRVVAAPGTSMRLGERNAPPAHFTTPVAREALLAPRVARAARVTVALQDGVHRERPRWRAYDAAAPPAPSHLAR